MKTKHIAIASLVILAVACQAPSEVVPDSAPFVKLGSKTLNAAAAPSQMTVTLTSNCDWKTSASESWVKVSPEQGNQSTRELTLLFEENTVEETPREAKVFIVGADASDTLYITQAAPAGPVPPGTELRTADDFKTFLSLAADFTTADVTKVFNDIDMGGATIAPVAKYAGTFDGQGHKIFNFKVEGQDAVTGLFLSNEGTIKDVVFGSKDGSSYDGVSVIGAAEGKGGGFTGLVAVNDGTLENVTTFVKINYVAAAAEAEVGVGGLVGNAVLNSVLRGCVNKAVITAAGEPTQVTDFGGLIGYMNQPARVENCANEAEISLSIPVKKVLHIGGLVGRINAAATVENSHNKADVSYRQEVSPSTWMSIGGVIGSDYNGGIVTGCSNRGNIFANTLQVVRIGGIMGVLNKSGKVENCTNEGSVTLEQEANANWQSAGGIIGFQEASQTNEKDNIIAGNTNKGPVTVTVENTTGHANKVAAGGILGEGCLALSVTDNVNLAPVKVTNKAAGPVYAGGIYGALIKNKVEILSSGNINAGSVTAATSDNAQAMAGGVVGYIAPASGGDANTVVITLTGDKSTGDVTGTAAMAGAAAGNNCNGALEACIVGGSVNGTALTAANYVSLTQGSASAGAANNTVFVGGAAEGPGLKSADDLKEFMTASDYSKWTDNGVVNVLADIDASSIESLQIAAIPEGVVIDGNNHSIYNIKTVSQENNTGLILENNGTVRNLRFGTKDGYTYDGVSAISAAEGKGGGYTALVAVNNGTLENVITYVTVNFVATTYTTPDHGGIAGLIGCAKGEKGYVKDCINRAQINASGKIPKESGLAGLIGCMPTSGVQVVNCANEANLTFNLPVAKVLHMGGLGGRIAAAVVFENCRNTGNLTYDEIEKPSTWTTLGGICGVAYLGATFNGCVNKGNLKSNINQVVRMGGILGTLNQGGTLSGCVNEGNLTIQQPTNANWQTAGGLVGLQEKSVTNDMDNVIMGSTNKGTIVVEVENATTHANEVSAGGIIGIACLQLRLVNNTNEGSVTIVNKAAGGVHAGGIMGSWVKATSLEMSGNVNKGAVSATTSDNAKASAGGVIGLNDVAATITLDKNLASVTCGRAEATGSIAGINKGTLENCIAGGSVNGTAVTASNLESLTQGSVSTGKANGTTLAQ